MKSLHRNSEDGLGPPNCHSRASEDPLSPADRGEGRSVVRKAVKLAKFISNLRTLWQTFGVWFYAAVVAVTSNLVGEAVSNTINALTSPEGAIISWLYVGYFVVWLGAISALYRHRAALGKPVIRGLAPDPNPRPCQHLILFLSDLRSSQWQPTTPQLTGDLSTDLGAHGEPETWYQVHDTKKPHPWEQAMRAIYHHRATLRTVTVIASKESISRLADFSKLLRLYEELAKVRLWVCVKDDRGRYTHKAFEPNERGNGIDFEDFEALARAVDTCLRSLRKNRVPDHEIMVDFTGGQKVTSVVAAAMTMNSGVRAQYVQTSREKRVLSYDVIVGSPEAGDLDL